VLHSEWRKIKSFTARVQSTDITDTTWPFRLFATNRSDIIEKYSHLPSAGQSLITCFTPASKSTGCQLHDLYLQKQLEIL
jgi:hypothetical protein